MSLLLRPLAFIPLCVLSGTLQASLISIDFSKDLSVAGSARFNAEQIDASGYALSTTNIGDSATSHHTRGQMLRASFAAVQADDRHFNPEGFSTFVADFEIRPLTVNGVEERPLSFEARQFWAGYRQTNINNTNIFATPSGQHIDNKAIGTGDIFKLKTGNAPVAASGFSSAFDPLVFKVPLPETAWLLLLSMLGLMALQRKPKH
jgi:hypothetical protein